MASIEERMADLGLHLEEPAPAIANYVGAVSQGDLVFLSGHGPYRAGRYEYIGKVPSQVSVKNAYQAARLSTLNALASARSEIGSLDRIRRIVKLLGMVNSDPEFAEQPQVINGASDLLVEIFGERGRHARSAVGVVALPMGISVEIEMIIEVEPARPR